MNQNDMLIFGNIEKMTFLNEKSAL